MILSFFAVQKVEAKTVNKTDEYIEYRVTNSDNSDININQDDQNRPYIVTGEMTKGGRLRIGDAKKQGTKEQPIVVYLSNLKIDASGRKESAIRICGGAHVVIYIGSYAEHQAGDYDRTNEVVLKGGGQGAALSIDPTGYATITGHGTLKATGDDKAAGIGGNKDDNYSSQSDAPHIVIKSIDGKGKVGPRIYAYGGSHAAGIGGSHDGQMYGIEIDAGQDSYIYAKGSDHGAGIGAGDTSGSGDGGSGGNYTIRSGKIDAYGGEGAAGIGTEGNPVKNIKIYGGEIYAKGGKDAAGIGSGHDSAKDIYIYGGTIEARGNEKAAGIGGGQDGITKNIVISGGDIKAYGGSHGAGIGAGDAQDGGDGGTLDGITISGGKIYAQGGTGAAGIGSEGRPAKKIVISGATIDARGGEEAAGIGSGSGGVNGITIKSGTIYAKGGKKGAGIGSGQDGLAENITISGGTIEAHGGHQGAGIGGGNNYMNGDGGDVHGLTITAGVIKSYGGYEASGIGGGHDSNVRDLVINQTKGKELNIYAEGGYRGAGIGSACDTPEDIYITIRGGSIEARGGADSDGDSHPSGAAGIGGGDDANVQRLSIKGYGKIKAYGGTNGPGIGGGQGEGFDSIEINNIQDKKASDEDKKLLEEIKGGQVLDIVAWADYNGTPKGIATEAAGIGGGSRKGGNIQIELAKINASGGDQGAAIGSGSGGSDVDQKMGGILIRDCEVKADDGYCVGIGSGHGSGIDFIELYNSTIDCGNHSIGTGSYNPVTVKVDRNTIKEIIIENCDIKASSSVSYVAGIGTGPSGDLEKMTITDSTIVAAGGKCAAGIGTGGI
ncbi:hypothetical protein LJC18_04555 [Lachnospiraceae bacterium OttesenSCG-928-E19]|nr:hypothetical protein [Lachnospiraceae bacterium OttesenSCG-928-E19]